MDFVNLFNRMLRIASGIEGFPFYTVVLSAVGVYLVLFLLEGIGLYSMAEKQGVSGKWQAFVPFANTYLIGRLAGDCPFLGKTLRKIHVWLLITELVSFVFGAAVLVFNVMLTLGTIDYDYTTPQILFGVETGIPHFSNVYLELFSNLMPLVTQLFDMIFFVFFIIALVNLFRKYSARNGLTIAMWSIMAQVFFGVPLYGIFIFAMRNNKAMDYKEYVKKRQAEYMRQTQAYQNQTRDPYEYYSRKNTSERPDPSQYKYDPYTGQPLHEEDKSEGEPFSDLGGKNNSDDGPFSF